MIPQVIERSDYIRNFVEGFGINLQNCKPNQDAETKWAEIRESLAISNDSIILICGAKNNGKSSLNRTLINQSKKKVYYIDFDPGQPEMTTPGIISAHFIRSKLQNPTYLNLGQHELIAASSVGGTNMSVNPRMYIDNCSFVFNQVKEHMNNSNKKKPIFINTMGFIRSVGIPILMDLIKLTSPTNVIVLNVVNNPMRTIYADLSPDVINKTHASFFYDNWRSKLDYKYDVHNLQFAYVDSTSIANKNRVALQLAYLAAIPEALYKPVMQLNPKWIPLESKSIYCVSSYPLKPAIVLELLVHSWVHLVRMRKPLIKPQSDNQQLSSEEEFCHIIDEVGENKIIGCGIITSIDLEKKSMAIITPLTQENLDNEIDCIIKPLSIQVAREVLQPGLI